MTSKSEQRVKPHPWTHPNINRLAGDCKLFDPLITYLFWSQVMLFIDLPGADISPIASRV